MRLINSAVVRAPGALVERGRSARPIDIPIRFGRIEARARRLLVDTGYGPRVLAGRRSNALRLYAALLNPRLEQVSPATLEADAIVVTHLHADHVARLRDLPPLPILASAAAIALVAKGDRRAALRHGVFLELLPDDFVTRAIAVETLPRVETGTTLGEGFDLTGDGCHLAIPLPGHAAGHLGIFWRGPTGPVLYATDAAWTRDALIEDRTPALSRAVVFDDADAGRRSEALVRSFDRAGGRVLLCHDPHDPGEG